MDDAFQSLSNRLAHGTVLTILRTVFASSAFSRQGANLSLPLPMMDDLLLTARFGDDDDDDAAGSDLDDDDGFNDIEEDDLGEDDGDNDLNSVDDDDSGF